MASPRSAAGPHDTGRVGQTETLYESASTRVSRVRSGTIGRTLVRKEFLGPDASARMARESEAIARFGGFGGVSQCVETDPYSNSLYLHDLRATDLAGSLAAGARFDTEQVLSIAIRLAEILAQVHRAGVVHGDVNPANVLMSRKGVPSLIDFDGATGMGAAPLSAGAGATAGTLAYAAPEQSGRTNRALDHRCDLYSLGVLIYELATGRLPFVRRDALELVHDHLVTHPQAPHELVPTVPTTLSRIILRLLEKEPGSRYQSAEGLVHDLSALRWALTTQGHPEFALGASDFPARLTAPGTLIGRAREIAFVHDAFEQAVVSTRRTLVIEGPAGVGKSALLGELKSSATARGGWFAYGKFDQYQRDADSFGGFASVLSALGRLLLAMPENTLAQLRRRISEKVGRSSTLLAQVPEFATLLGAPSDAAAPVDPRQAEVRLAVAVIDLLAVVAAPDRPIVLALDDVQWAGARSLQLIDKIVSEPSLRGVMIVLACRRDEIAPGSGPADMLARWAAGQDPPAVLTVANLALAHVSELVADILRVDSARAAELANAMMEVCGGNPFDTVELANAWRDSGVLRLAADGWHWDSKALVATAMRADVLDMLSERLSRLGAAERRTLDVMGCLGGSVEIELLALASGVGDAAMLAAAATLEEEGFLARDSGENGPVRFRHDRVQEAVHNAMDAATRERLHLDLCRRLIDDGRFEHRAAQQFLKCRALVREPAEKQRVVRHMLGVARQLSDEANYVLAGTYLDAAASLLEDGDDALEPLWRQVACARHVALYSTGRAEEADHIYAALRARVGDALELIEPACLQIRSLDMRGRMQDSLALGLELLAQLGFAAPPGFEDPQAERRLDALAGWIATDRLADHARRAGEVPPRAAAAARILERMVRSAFFLNDTVALRWLLLEMQRLWTEHGPLPAMIASLGRMGNVLLAEGRGYRLAYEFVRHILDVAEALRVEPQTSECRYTFIHYTCHWFEPLEENLRQAQLAIEGIRASGDESYGSYVHGGRVMSVLDQGPTLGEYEDAIASARLLARRSGNRHTDSWHLCEQQLARALRGRTRDATFSDAEFDEEAFVAEMHRLPLVDLLYHCRRGLLALLMGDTPGLQRHGAEARRLTAPFPGMYYHAHIHVYLAVAASSRSREEPGCDVAALLEQADAAVAWFTERAADQPANFRHLLRLVQAERAWLAGDLWAATAAFDAAMQEARTRQRPWHRALIAERAARFYLFAGVEYGGRQVMAVALASYERWGAHEKATRLRNEFGWLVPDAANSAVPPPRSSVSSGSGGASPQNIDLVGVVRASQALSSETNIASLVARVTDVLAAMTGATKVSVLSFHDGQWVLLQPQGAGTQMPLDDAVARGLVPVSVFSYAARTGQPIAVDEIQADDRFARDPYFAGAVQRSIMAAPVASHGVTQAVLLLENDASRGAFNAARLDAIMLIGRQLAVSLENARLYQSLEERVAQRTRDLEVAHAQIVATARRAGMAEIANSVLHNVGNVLNSVNTSATLAAGKLHHSRAGGLSRALELLREHEADIGAYLRDDERGKLLLPYLGQLAQAMEAERNELAAELQHLVRNVGHIKDIVATQQSHAGASSMVQMGNVHELIEEALHMSATPLAAARIAVERRFEPVPELAVDRPKLLQILVNLVTNAIDAMEQTPPGRRKLIVACGIAAEGDARSLRFKVEDSGSGIDADTLGKIFAHGFTTKKDGHGFGLHGSVLAARDMGGRLTAASDGPGRGAVFTLELPMAATG